MFKPVLLASLLALAPCAVLAAELPAYPFIHASGSGIISAVPDRGEIDFEIAVQDADAAVALATVEERVAAIRALLQQSGLPDTDVEIRDIRRELRKGDAVVHELRCGVAIKVRELSKWTAFVTPLLLIPNLDGFMTSFDTGERDAIEADLMKQALLQARRKAESIAAGIGRKLGPANAVSHGDLKNLTRSMGLAPSESGYRQSGPRPPADRGALVQVTSLRFGQSVDVIYRLK